MGNLGKNREEEVFAECVAGVMRLTPRETARGYAVEGGSMYGFHLDHFTFSCFLP